MSFEIPLPPIEPSKFDLIVIGTSLPSSLISSASSSVGKSVLHLDPNPFYGSHFSSLSLTEFTSFLHSQTVTQSPHHVPYHTPYHVPLYPTATYSHVSLSPLPDPLPKVSIDLSGPTALLSAGPTVETLIKFQANHYLEFKAIDSTFLSSRDGSMWSVPDSRSAIFKDRTLGLADKYHLSRIFKLVQTHFDADVDSVINQEDLESPFSEFLTKMRLTARIKLAILYAIAMADYDQESKEVCKGVLKTKDGIDRLALYHSSVGRFQNTSGALIYPIYGQGELPQSFCRRAAVKGCIYVLRMPVIALLLDQESRQYKGVKLSSGQEIFSPKLVMDPYFTVQLPVASRPPDLVPKSPSFKPSQAKVARAICLTKSSLKADVSNFILVYPPRSLYPEQVSAIRALQIGSNLAVCPAGMFILYISALCEDVDEGKMLLHAAIDTLFAHPVSENNRSDYLVEAKNKVKPTDSLFTPLVCENNESDSPVEAKNTEVKPTLFWSALYIQELTMLDSSFEPVSFTTMPDGNLDYSDVIGSAKKIFHQMYPNEEFFPDKSVENEEDDGKLSSES